MKRPIAAVLTAALLASTGGCTVTGLGPGSYRLTAYFAKTPSLYEQSRVKVMGADIGTVTSIRADGSRVRVEFTVSRDVPVPKGLHVAISAANPLGERSLVLSPTWKPGMPKAAPGDVIPQDRTGLPAEIDETLAAFTGLTDALDPAKVRTITKGAANALRGHGKQVNDALRSTATLTHDLARQDTELIEIARGLHKVADGLNRRDRKLGSLISSFSATGRLLASERTQLRTFLSGLADLIRQGDGLITSYQETLPTMLETSSEFLMTMRANSGSLSQAISGLRRLLEVLSAALDRKRGLGVGRLVLNAEVRAWLQPLFTAMGWGRVPCAKKPLGNCPWQDGGRR